MTESSQAGGEREAFEALNACLSACERVIEHEGVFEGIDFHALKKGVERGIAALSASPAITEAGDGMAKTLILLSTGEYSDYDVMGAFRPIRDFTVGEALEVFREQWKPEKGAYSSDPGPSDFAAWLAKEGYVEDAPTEEIHLGCYGEVALSTDSLKLSFVATPVAAIAQPAQINGAPATARSLLEALIDIDDDYRKNAPEDRCYVESAWPDCLAEVRKFIAAQPQGAAVAQPVAVSMPSNTTADVVSASMRKHGVTLTAAGFYWASLLYEEAQAVGAASAPASLTDAQIIDVADDFKSQYRHGGTTFDEFDYMGFARAVLALAASPSCERQDVGGWK